MTFQVATATSVLASWTGDAPGATCSATFSVRDAQNRTTSGERDGRLLLDLLGYPKAPASVVQTAYADQTVTLRVDPGESRLAHPALVQHQDLVHVLDRGEPMGNRDRRAAGYQHFQGVADQEFRLGVDARRGLVENQHAGVEG